MSAGDGQTFLRFSLGGTAWKAVLVGLLTAVFGSIAFAFGLHFDWFSTDYMGGRSQWFWELAYSNGGKTGAIIFALLTLLCAWLLIALCRRFFTSGMAAALTERGLLLHPTYRKRELPYAEIASAKVSRKAFLINTHHLFIKPAGGRRRIRLQENEIEGGREALEAFAAELNARRIFEGSAPRIDG